MNKNLTLTYLSVFLVVSLISLRELKSEPEKTPQIVSDAKSRLDVSPKITFKQDDLLCIDVTLTNDNDVDYSRVDNLSATRGFVLDLFDEHNNNVQMSSFGKTYFSNSLGGVSRSIELLPKKSKKSYRIYLGRIFDLTNEGVYTLKISKVFYTEKETVGFNGSTNLTIEDGPVIKEINGNSKIKNDT